MAKCANCGASLGCGCQKRTLANGTIGCVNCAGKTSSTTQTKTNVRSKVTPTGFVVGLNKIYVSTNIGRLLIVDIASGQTITTLKIDNEKIAQPFIIDKKLFVIKDNAIIKLN